MFGFKLSVCQDVPVHAGLALKSATEICVIMCLFQVSTGMMEFIDDVQKVPCYVPNVFSAQILPSAPLHVTCWQLLAGVLGGGARVWEGGMGFNSQRCPIHSNSTGRHAAAYTGT